MKTTRTLSLRKEVLTELADAELGLVVGGDAHQTLPASWCATLCNTCLTCYWTCLCIQ